MNAPNEFVNEAVLQYATVSGVPLRHDGDARRMLKNVVVKIRIPQSKLVDEHADGAVIRVNGAIKLNFMRFEITFNTGDVITNGSRQDVIVRRSGPRRTDVNVG